MAVSTTEPTAVAIEAAAPLRARRLRLPRSPKVLVGLGLLIAFLVLAAVGPLIAPYNPSADLAASGTPQPPSAAHWLGTTQTQQDVLSQLLAGGRSTIVVAFLFLYVPWFFDARTNFLFYMAPMTPFMVLAGVYALRDLSTVRIGAERMRALAPVAGFLVLVSVVVFLFFLPLLTGRAVSYAAWHQRIWMRSWI